MSTLCEKDEGGSPLADYRRSAQTTLQHALPAPFNRAEIGAVVGSGSSSYVFRTKLEDGSALVSKYIDSRIPSPEYWGELSISGIGRMIERELNLMQEISDSHHPDFLPLLASGMLCWKDSDQKPTAYSAIILMRPYDHLVHTMELSCVSEAELKQMLLQLLEDLRFLHEDIHAVHRDIKPSNLFMTQEDHKHILVADYGTALKLDPYTNAAEPVCGTASYLPPQLKVWMDRGEYANHLVEADLYAAIATFIRLMGGISPNFQGITPRPVPKDCRLGRALEALLDKGTYDELPFHSARELTRYVEQIQVSEDHLIDGPLRLALNALKRNPEEHNLDEIFEALARGQLFSGEGCERMLHFLHAETAATEKDRQQALSDLQKLASAGDGIANGLYWVSLARSQVNYTQEVLEGLEASDFPYAQYLCGHYLWLKGSTPAVRQHGAFLIRYAAENGGVPEARRCIANYLFLYEHVPYQVSRGLYNYMSNFAKDLRAISPDPEHPTYYGYPVRTDYTQEKNPRPKYLDFGQIV